MLFVLTREDVYKLLTEHAATVDEYVNEGHTPKYANHEAAQGAIAELKQGKTITVSVPTLVSSLASAMEAHDASQ